MSALKRTRIGDDRAELRGARIRNRSYYRCKTLVSIVLLEIGSPVSFCPTLTSSASRSPTFRRSKMVISRWSTGDRRTCSNFPIRLIAEPRLHPVRCKMNFAFCTPLSFLAFSISIAVKP